MVACYVFGTQVFPGLEILGESDGFFRDHRIGDGARWFSLCPHGSETRASRGTRQKVQFCRECGQEHYSWLKLDSQTSFLPGSTGKRGHFNPLSSLVIFHEAEQPLPGKFLIGLPPSQQDATIVLWRVLVPEVNGAVISTLGSALYRSTGEYPNAGKKFHVVEMLALVDHDHGMAVSTTNWRITLTWDGAQINFKTTQRVPQTVDS